MEVLAFAHVQELVKLPMVRDLTPKCVGAAKLRKNKTIYICMSSSGFIPSLKTCGITRRVTTSSNSPQLQKVKLMSFDHPTLPLDAVDQCAF